MKCRIRPTEAPVTGGWLLEEPGRFWPSPPMDWVNALRLANGGAVIEATGGELPRFTPRGWSRDAEGRWFFWWSCDACELLADLGPGTTFTVYPAEHAKLHEAPRWVLGDRAILDDPLPVWTPNSPPPVYHMPKGPAYDDPESRVGSQAVGHDPSREYATLGHVAAELRRMLADGISESSIRYVLQRVEGES